MNIQQVKTKAAKLTSISNEGVVKLKRQKKAIVQKKNKIDQATRLLNVLKNVQNQYTDKLSSMTVEKQGELIESLMSLVEQTLTECSKMEEHFEKQNKEIKRLMDTTITMEESLLKRVYELNYKLAKRKDPENRVIIYDSEYIMEELDSPFCST